VALATNTVVGSAGDVLVVENRYVGAPSALPEVFAGPWLAKLAVTEPKGRASFCRRTRAVEPSTVLLSNFGASPAPTAMTCPGASSATGTRLQATVVRNASPFALPGAASSTTLEITAQAAAATTTCACTVSLVKAITGCEVAEHLRFRAAGTTSRPTAMAFFANSDLVLHVDRTVSGAQRPVELSVPLARARRTDVDLDGTPSVWFEVDSFLDVPDGLTDAKLTGVSLRLAGSNVQDEHQLRIEELALVDVPVPVTVY